MGLFTNRKRNDDTDLVDPARAIAIPLGVDEPEVADDEVVAEIAADEIVAHEIAADEAPVELDAIAVDVTDAVVPEALTIVESSDIDAVDPDPAPIVDTEPIDTIDVDAAPISDVAPGATPLPERRLVDRPRAQAGNVEIDAEGLLSLLGLDPDAPLAEVSDAHLRFVADHEPNDSDDEATVEIKARIQREVKSAYASFRLTRLG